MCQATGGAALDIGLECCHHVRCRDPRARDELAPAVAYGRHERRGPDVLVDNQRGDASGKNRVSCLCNFLFPEKSALCAVKVGERLRGTAWISELEDLDGAVLVLHNYEEIEEPDHTLLNKPYQLFTGPPRQSSHGELEEHKVDRPVGLGLRCGCHWHPSVLFRAHCPARSS